MLPENFHILAPYNHNLLCTEMYAKSQHKRAHNCELEPKIKRNGFQSFYKYLKVRLSKLDAA